MRRLRKAWPKSLFGIPGQFFRRGVTALRDRTYYTNGPVPGRITTVARNAPTLISHRAKAQACIGMHRGRKSKLASRLKQPRNLAQRGLARGLGHAFPATQEVGICPDRIGADSNSSVEVPATSWRSELGVPATSWRRNANSRADISAARLRAAAENHADPHPGLPPLRGRRGPDHVLADADTLPSDSGCERVSN